MLKKVVYVALLVSDQDRAVDFYTKVMASPTCVATMMVRYRSRRCRKRASPITHPSTKPADSWSKLQSLMRFAGPWS